MPGSARKLAAAATGVTIAIAVVVFIVVGTDRGTTVASPDGRMAVFFPPGALPEGIDADDIRILPLEPRPVVDGGRPLVGYALQPSGTVFATRVTATYSSTVPQGRNDVAVPVFFHETAVGLEWIDGAVTTADLASGEISTTFPLASFSRIYVAEEALMRVTAFAPPPTPVGQKVRLNAAVTQRFGTAAYRPDWGEGSPFRPDQVEAYEWVREAHEAIERGTDWFRRMQTFTIPGQGNVSLATADFVGSFEEIGGPILSPRVRIENRPFRRAITAAMVEKDLWTREMSFDDLTCEKEGRTQVAWTFAWQGFSSRPEQGEEHPASIASGEFRLFVPVVCGDEPAAFPSACEEGGGGVPAPIVVQEGMLKICVTPPKPTPVGGRLLLRADIEGVHGRAYGGPDRPELYALVEYHFPGHGMRFANVTEFEGQIEETDADKILAPKDIIGRKPGASEIKMTAADARVPTLPPVFVTEFTCAEAGRTTLEWAFPYDVYSTREYREGENEDVTQVRGEIKVPVPAVCLGEPVCGNGVVEDGEECDGADLDGRTCEDLGREGGMLRCSSSCFLDAEGCTGEAGDFSGKCATHDLLERDECPGACARVPDQYGGCTCEEAWDTPGCYIMRFGPE